MWTKSVFESVFPYSVPLKSVYLTFEGHFIIAFPLWGVYRKAYYHCKVDLSETVWLFHGKARQMLNLLIAFSTSPSPST